MTTIEPRSRTARRWRRRSDCRGCPRSRKASSCARRASTTSRLTWTRSRTCAPTAANALHAQSHGESFISLFANRFEQGLYILDEPEAAFRRSGSSRSSRSSTTCDAGHAQFLIATHSPILLAYPGAVLFGLDGETIRGGQLSRDEALPDHPRLSRLAGEILQTPVDVWR